MAHRLPRPLWSVCFCLILGLPLAAGAGPAPDATADARSQITELIRTDHRDAALKLCQQYTATHPDDPLMLYNLACLENTAGHLQAAIDAYARALAGGFTALGTASDDPDLQGAVHGTIVDMNRQKEIRLKERALANGLTLDYGSWSPVRQLTGIGAAPAPTLRLRWQESGLELEFTGGGVWGQMFEGSAPSASRGGPAVDVELAVLPDDSPLVSVNRFQFRFGLSGKSAAGSIRLAGRNQWQQVRELIPKIRGAANGALTMTAFIPWQLISPYHPVLDTPLGINASARRITDGHPVSAALVAPISARLAPAGARIYAPLRFRTDSMTGDFFAGKLDNSLSSTRPLDLTLVAVSAKAGAATLTLDFLDQAGHSVLPGGAIRGNSELRQGTNRITRQVDFSGLSDGGYVLQTALEFPSGHTEKWKTGVLQLAPDWQKIYTDRIATVPAAEQATVRYLLETTAEAVAHHLPRRHPGPIITTLFELEEMLVRVRANGTILPTRGTLIFIYPGPGDRPRVCHLYLPATHEIAAGVNPVLVLATAPVQSARIAARIGRNYDYGDHLPTHKKGGDRLFPVFLVPELRPDASNMAAEVAACRRWATAYFAAPTTSLVGVDALGAIALDALTDTGAGLQGVLIFSGRHLEPHPLMPSGPPPTAPVTWLVFSGETAAARNTRTAMRQQGYPVAAVQSVEGGLSLTQVADRVVLWAESLR